MSLIIGYNGPIIGYNVDIMSLIGYNVDIMSFIGYNVDIMSI